MRMSESKYRAARRLPGALGKRVVHTVLPAQFRAKVASISWRDLLLTVGPFLLLLAGLLAALVWVLDPAPPGELVISSGPEGSAFHNNAKKYQTILARNGIRLVVLPSEGSQENLSRLRDPKSRVDIGFVLDGSAAEAANDKLVSLGSVSHQPLFVFYRGDKVVTRLDEFKGLRLSIGRLGSGARALALSLLKAGGITAGSGTQLRALEAVDAVQELLDANIDAVFLMGDSASPAMIRKLLFAPGIRLLDLAQADAYVRRFAYLNKLPIPMGAFDLEQNLPTADMQLIAPTVELVARQGLHPALSDLLIETAREVHGRRTILQEAGEFPAAKSSDFTLSDDAARYYKYGKGFFYRNLPFWMASMVDRIVIVIVPLTVILIPALRILPWAYRWRVRSRIYRWYAALISLERGLQGEVRAEDHAPLLARLDEIEQAVNKLNMPLAFVDQLYVLREHIGFVRTRLNGLFAHRS